MSRIGKKAPVLVALALLLPLFPSMAGEPEGNHCAVLRLPDGATVRQATGGEGLLVTLPVGYAFSASNGGVRLVSVDPDTVLYLPPDMLAAAVIDCDCDGSTGGCTEGYNPSTGNVFCDRYGGCPDCKMKVSQTTVSEAE